MQSKGMMSLPTDGSRDIIHRSIYWYMTGECLFTKYVQNMFIKPSSYSSLHHLIIMCLLSSLRLRVSDTTVTISEEETCGLVSRYHSPTVVSLCDGSAGSCRDSAPQLRLHHGYWSGFDNCNNVYKSLFKIFSCLSKERINTYKANQVLNQLSVSPFPCFQLQKWLPICVVH